MKILWPHHYRVEKKYITITKKTAERWGMPEVAGKTLPYWYEWRLYDWGKCVYIDGCKSQDNDERSKQLSEHVDAEFLEMKENYIKSHKYFNKVLWKIKHDYPIPVINEW